MTPKKVTINDIAAAAGVSKTTVSRYINGHGDMLSDASRKRVEKAIQLADYRPSAVARSLKTQKSYLVGVVLANITTPFATSLINGISSGLADGGDVPIFADAADSPATENRILQTLVSHQVDGLLVNTTSGDNPRLVELANSGMPVVLIDRTIRHYDLDIVTAPYSKPTVDLMNHLKDQGFGRVVLFTQPFENNSPREIRRNAFLAANEELFGVDSTLRDVRVVDPLDPQGVQVAIRDVLQTTPAEEHCALYATNTITLIAVYNAMCALGLRAPGDLGLCGPDDWGWAHRIGWDWPESLAGGITTFETDPSTMGHEAARLLLTRIQNPSQVREKRYVPVTMRLRASTRLG